MTRSLDVLGGVRLHMPGAPAVLRMRKAVALLAYLALQPDRCARRETIASLLWPRVSPEAARTSLRQLLAALRRASGDAPLLIGGSAEQLVLDPDIVIDADLFRQAVRQGGLEADRTAATLYRGPLLAEGVAVDSADYDDWLATTREALCRDAVRVFERLAAAGLNGEIPIEEALEAAEHATRLDSYNEHAARALMRLHVRAGRPDLALRHYTALAELLRRDLQVDPEAETLGLYESLRAARSGGATVPEAPPAPPAPTPAPKSTPSPPRATQMPAVAAGTPARRWTMPVLIGMVAALLIAAAAGVHRTLTSPARPPAVENLFPVANDPALEQRPAVSPDGTHVVFTARLEEPGNVDLYVVTIGDQTPVRLTRDPAIDDNAAWTPDGSAIAFTRTPRDGRGTCAIMVMPVPAGQERIAGHCATALTSRLSWGPDGRTLYYSDAASRGSVTRIYRLDMDSGRTVPVTDPPQNIQGDSEPRLSRDGRTLAFIRTRAWQSNEAMAQDLPSGAARPLTQDGKTVWDIAWGPGDRGLIFSSDRAGDTGLWWIGRDGRGLSRLAVGSLEYRALSYARNRERLVFEMLRDRASFQALPPDATTETRPEPIANLRTNLFDRFYDEATNGRITFVSTRSGPEELWVAEPGGPPRQITRSKDVFHQEPTWSPDGRWIAYIGVTRGQSNIWLITGDGGAPRRLSADPAIQQSPAWSPDGRFLYFTSRHSGRWNIWRLDPFGKGEPVSLNQEGARTVRPSKDGRYLYYTLDGVPGIRRRALAPGGARLVGRETLVAPDLHPSDWRNWALHGTDTLFYARRGGGDPGGLIMRRDLRTGAERAVTDATNLLWSASFAVRPDGGLVLTHRELEIDLSGIDFR